MEHGISIPAWMLSGLGVFILTQTGFIIWWAATITEKINGLSAKIEGLSKENFAKKEDVDRDFGRLQKDVDAAHKRIDNIQLKG